MTLRCPACRVELHEAAVPGGGVSVCTACGGAWLDNPRSHAVVAGLLGVAAKQAALRAEATAGQTPAGIYRAPARDVGGTRVCAECARPLVASVVKAVEITIDACAAHGNWFDAGELWPMAHHFELKAARDSDDVAAFGRRIERDRYSEGGVLDILVAILSSRR